MKENIVRLKVKWKQKERGPTSRIDDDDDELLIAFFVAFLFRVTGAEAADQNDDICGLCDDGCRLKNCAVFTTRIWDVLFSSRNWCYLQSCTSSTNNIWRITYSFFLDCLTNIFHLLGIVVGREQKLGSLICAYYHGPYPNWSNTNRQQIEIWLSKLKRLYHWVPEMELRKEFKSMGATRSPGLMKKASNVNAVICCGEPNWIDGQHWVLGTVRKASRVVPMALRASRAVLKALLSSSLQPVAGASEHVASSTPPKGDSRRRHLIFNLVL